jgi:hypothetical protein
MLAAEFALAFGLGEERVFFLGAGLSVVVFLLLNTLKVRWSRQIFVVTGLLLFIIALATRPDWMALTERALKSGAFVAAFFSALAAVRSAAGSSEDIRRCGRFLADQPPGRRYLALTLGGHLFGIILLYGSITLLGSLAETSARGEQNEEIRRIRTRRMLLAIQRGFIATLCWSPLTFSLAITTSIVPGASWGGVVGFGAVSAFLLAGTGWALDSIFKPKLSGPRPKRGPADNHWEKLAPLLILLTLLMGLVGALHYTTGLRTAAAVMLVVPILSFAWIMLQVRGSAKFRGAYAARRAKRFVEAELPAYRPELVLLVMAAFIGTLGSGLLGPWMAESGLDFTSVPVWLLLLVLLWLVPVTGQLGMNPILAVSLIGPLIPEAAAFGLSPNVVVLAIIAGWALSGASSPFTATTLMVGALGKVSALHVGWRWNLSYTLVSGLLLSIWVLAVAYLV